MKTILLIATLSISWSYFAQNFQKTFGGPGTERGYAVVSTYDGGYALAGNTNSFGAGGQDFFVIKTDAFGNTLWQKTYGGDNNEGINVRVELALTPDSGLLLGGSTGSYGSAAGDGYLLKLDANGNVLWDYKYTSSSAQESIHEFKMLANGDILLLGSDNQAMFGSSDGLLARLDSNGNVIWSKVYGGSVNDSFGGAMELSGGNFIVTGATSTYGPGTYGAYLIKVDPNGNMIWDYSYGGSGIEGFSASLLTDDNYIIATGPTGFGSGNSDILLTKLDTNGVVQWSKAYGGTSFERGVSVTSIPNSTDLYVGALTQSFGNGSYDILIMRTNSSGDIIWSKTFGTAGSDQIHIYGAKSTLQSTNDGGFVFTGWSDSLSVGGDDMIFVKGDSLGSILCNDVVVNVTTFSLPMIDPSSNQATVGSYISVNSTVNVPTFSDSTMCYCVDPGVCDNCLPPQADFVSDTTNGLSIQFTDMSSDPINWQWDFGDGYLSTLQDPTHIYSAPGTYTVCLIVTNSCGEDTTCMTINICELPIADFSFNEMASNVQFTDLSTNSTSWQWDFGDGNQSTSQDPYHTYASPGSYTVCLIATNSCNSDTICKPVCICESPVADFVADTTSGTTVQFTSTSLGATTWYWDFGDGDTSTVQNPDHVYASAGTYTICLIVSNICDTDTACTLIYVCDQPVANFVADSISGTAVSFGDLSVNAVMWQWDFGDGNQSTNQNPTHVYLSPGWYDVCLIVSNDCATDTLCDHIFVDGSNWVGDKEMSDLFIHPNPTSGIVHINGEVNGPIRVLDMFGRLILVSEELEFDMTTHPKGIYFLHINEEIFKLILR